MRLKIPFNNKLIQLYLEKGKLQFFLKPGRKFLLNQTQKIAASVSFNLSVSSF